MPGKQVHRLILDVSEEANFPPSAVAATVPPRESTKQWAATEAARTALGLIPARQHDREKALRYFRPSDAALSLASSLLKHVAVARATGTPWADTLVTQERHLDNGKPFYAPGGVNFNASHHGELGVLAWAKRGDGHDGHEEPGAKPGNTPHVGIDVVTVDTAKGLADLQRSGSWCEWARIFSDAFAPTEMAAIEAAGQGLDARDPEPRALEHALRTFYAYWALKEAYIKMTSEAFMADWLRVLEFRNVRLPEAAAAAVAASTAPPLLDQAGVIHDDDNTSGGRWQEGETVRDIEVWLRGERVPYVQIEIQAVGRDYMIATAVDRRADIGQIERVNVRDHIIPLARQKRT